MAADDTKRDLQPDPALQRRYDELTKSDNSTFWGGLAIAFGGAVSIDQIFGLDGAPNASYAGFGLLAFACGFFPFFEKRRKDKLATEIYFEMHGRKDPPKAEPVAQPATGAWGRTPPNPTPKPNIKPGAASLSNVLAIAAIALTAFTWWIFGLNFESATQR